MSNRLDPDDLATGLIHLGPSSEIVWANRAGADLLGLPANSAAGHALAGVDAQLGRWVERLGDGEQALHAPEITLACSSQVVDAFLHRNGDGAWIELHPVAERVVQRQRAERMDRQQAVALLSRHLAHELRNPLAGVRGAAQLIAARVDDATARRHAELIQREVDRITRLLERFATDNENRSGPVNLHQVLTESAELIAAEQGGALRVDRDFDPSIPPLAADDSQLHQLFVNLLRNAAQAGADHIILRSRIEHQSALVDPPSRHAVCIDIDDNGGGVPDVLRDRLFLPLVSGRDHGSGFGLAIVQQIARAHGGLVEHEALERGSRFRVRLPLVPAGVFGDD
ncbi:MAG: hypothetical protein HND55_02350 [Pseudomonadota bacterium]|nr:MAG: hypothetical protein HND55_02350 [Pseudomonadota bacterium]